MSYTDALLRQLSYARHGRGTIADRRSLAEDSKMTKRRNRVVGGLLAVALFSARALAQVQTEVPAIIPEQSRSRWSTSRFTAPHWRATWKAMRLTVTCSSSCRPATRAKSRGAIPSSTPCMAIRSAPSNGPQEIHVPQTIEGAFAQGAHEMIVVLPDSKTAHNGSMYSSSVTTGDFEKFIAHDVVQYIDSHYRTHRRANEPRPRGPLDGRLRGHPHRHEALRCLRQPLHHEPLLSVGPRARPRQPPTSRRRWRP